MQSLFTNLLMLLILGVSARWLYATFARRQVAGRLEAQVDETQQSGAPQGTALWLLRAGYRSPEASSLFIAATAAGGVAGLLFYWMLSRPAVRGWLESLGGDIAVGFGGLAGVLSLVAPVAVSFFAAVTPYLIVRRARRVRVEALERELPVALELLATLAEAGVGFDGGIATILETEPEDSPMGDELEIFQRDVLSGIPRVQALRNLASRCDLPSMTTFVTSLIQAELAGASMAETLRRQADDLRDRRKMQAVFLSQALPVKLVFPLLVCFLPGLFVATLGPALNQLIRVVDSAIKHPR